ncbi:UNVERIFIED_CONTAM: hypothetical protein NY100_25360, partial [Prevotella sp. 15_C9]
VSKGIISIESCSISDKSKYSSTTSGSIKISFKPSLGTYLSDEEKHEYLHELRMNTVAMVNYKFLDCKLKTPLCSIVGREDEPTIRN